MKTWFWVDKREKVLIFGKGSGEILNIFEEWINLSYFSWVLSMHNLENWDDIENCALEFVTCLKPNMKEFSRMPDFKD